jgi:hypothetical protein
MNTIKEASQLKDPENSMQIAKDFFFANVSIAPGIVPSAP